MREARYYRLFGVLDQDISWVNRKQLLRNTQMSAQTFFDHRMPTHVELHEARRRAGVERAKVIRGLFAALRTWRRKRAEEAKTTVAVAACR